MAKNYDSLGVMIDFSRNGVMTVESLKAFLSTIKKMGYNTLFLYMEDTYEVEGEPYFGYMRSRYSIKEMKEIDEFCTSIGVEAIPCIQTLAHMKTFFKWGHLQAYRAYVQDSFLLLQVKAHSYRYGRGAPSR